MSILNDNAPQPILMAWDPGGTTGYCIGRRLREGSGFEVLQSGAVVWSDRLSKIYRLIQHWRPVTTVVEQFTLYEHKAKDQIGSHFPSCEVIGIIEFVLWQQGLALPVYRPAAVIKKPEVRILPEHEPLLQTSSHARDAYRHLRYHIEKRPPVKLPLPVRGA